MSHETPRELPILTDVVELHATGSFPKPERATQPEPAFAGGLLSEEDVAALQAELVTRTLNLTDELLHSAAREIEAVMLERVTDRLRAALPELVAAALREQLAPGED
ncbi:MAG TPA: hypothetical protein VFM30_09650 [Steroidobacteraceae bacterium]|jgi:hypothetical protein|nr:hypothetical protein [Steroidobacteraceae bacterium]